MKSLEETIKQKCKFLGNSRIPYELYNFTVPTNTINDITLFLTNSNIETESIITLIEEMIPLFVYIFSCLKYHDISGTVDLDLKLKFGNSNFKYKEFINLNDKFFLDNPIERLTSKRSWIKKRGYYNTFKGPFRVEIILSIIYMSHIFDPIANHEEENQTEEFTYEEENQTEEFTYEEEYEPEDEEDEEEEEVINVTKTEECVICKENGPNILFCNCGHLCICNNCLEFKKLSKCPVCKTENTILRVIE